MNTERIKIMETEEDIIERLVRQGSSDEELFNKYPEYVGHITRYRKFLIEELTIKAEGLQEAIGEGGIRSLFRRTTSSYASRHGTSVCKSKQV